MNSIQTINGKVNQDAQWCLGYKKDTAKMETKNLFETPEVSFDLQPFRFTEAKAEIADELKVTRLRAFGNSFAAFSGDGLY
jgi:hypothetical protein